MTFTLLNRRARRAGAALALQAAGRASFGNAESTVLHSDTDARTVFEQDRDWFRTHPGRRFRIRPLRVADVPPGLTFEPGHKVLVFHADGIQNRAVLAPQYRDTPDTEAACAALWRRVREHMPDAVDAVVAFKRAFHSENGPPRVLITVPGAAGPPPQNTTADGAGTPSAGKCGKED